MFFTAFMHKLFTSCHPTCSWLPSNLQS